MQQIRRLENANKRKHYLSLKEKVVDTFQEVGGRLISERDLSKIIADNAFRNIRDMPK